MCAQAAGSAERIFDLMEVDRCDIKKRSVATHFLFVHQ